MEEQYRYGYTVFLNINICRTNLQDVKQLTEIAREYKISTDYHINEAPLVEQPHFKHMSDNSNYSPGGPFNSRRIAGLAHREAEVWISDAQFDQAPRGNEALSSWGASRALELSRRSEHLDCSRRWHTGAVFPTVLSDSSLGQRRRAQLIGGN